MLSLARVQQHSGSSSHDHPRITVSKFCCYVWKESNLCDGNRLNSGRAGQGSTVRFPLSQKSDGGLFHLIILGGTISFLTRTPIDNTTVPAFGNSFFGKLGHTHTHQHQHQHQDKRVVHIACRGLAARWSTSTGTPRILRQTFCNLRLLRPHPPDDETRRRRLGQWQGEALACGKGFCL